ncbi:beta strand repeat-containing protein [Paraburkholderia caribensis]|uniref:beta strand repeat-containing protein n=1 Tax=Paraburkholderia caribensis TaxID=75105 RepID=UPI0034D15FD5
MTAAHAQNIVATGGTTVGQHNGVDVVNIVAPNANGLSLNTFNQYNVGTRGAVLNNSTTGGASQLAGQLAANAQLQGQAAKVILNEVVGTNPSLLLGKQEVFGMAAAYVLANPNGITCTGCGFINTPRVSLAVGTPEFVNGNIASFAVGSNGNSTALSVSGNVSGTNVLDLIAPRVNIDGNIQARDSVNIVAGRQHVDYVGLAQHALTENENAGVSSAPLDGSAVGSISTGTIRIYNSDPNATTSVQANLNAVQSVDVQTAGNFSVTASQITAPEIAIAANNVAMQGQRHATDATAAPTSSTSVNWTTNTTSGSSHEEIFTATEIQSDNISLSAVGTANLNAVQINANNVNVTAGNVSLGSTVTKNTASSVDTQSQGISRSASARATQAQTLYGNNWNVAQNIGINATNGTVSSSAATIAAGGSVAIAGQGVTLGGATTQNGLTLTNSYSNQTEQLKTGQQVTADAKQTYHSTSITAGANVIIGSSGDVNLLGTQVNATQVAVASQGTTSIGAQASQNTRSEQENFTYWGGLVGGGGDGSQTTATTQNGSSINGQNVVVRGDGGVNVAGSALNGTRSLQLASANGSVSVGNTFNEVATSQDSRHGTAFNVTDNSHTSQTDADTTVASTIVSQGAIQVSSTKDVSLTGSSIAAGGVLSVNATGTIHSDIADAQTSTTTQDFTLGSVPNGRITTSGTTVNVTAGIGLQGVTHTFGQSSGVATASTLTGGTVTLQGDAAIDLKGAQIAASAGDVKVTGKNVNVAAGDSKVSGNFDDTNVTGGGIFLTGQIGNISTSGLGVGEIGVGPQVSTHQSNSGNESHQAIFSTIKSSGNVTMQADQQLQNTGTFVSTPGEISLTASEIVNNAAATTSTKTLVSGDGNLAVTASTGISSPVSISLSPAAQGSRSTTVNTTAVATTLAGGQINVNGTNTATDVGTQYAASGDINIHGGTYTGNAAENSQVTTTQSGSLGTSVKASTSMTFQDLGVKASANGGYRYQQTGKAQAVLGGINAQNVTIQADNTLSSAMNIKAADSVNLAAKQGVTIAQANNSQWQTEGALSAGVGLGGTVLPAAAVIVPSSLSINGGLNYLNVKDSQAAAANLAGKRITISAANSVVAQGATLTANDVTLQAANVNFDAGYDHHDAFGIGTRGNVSANLVLATDSVTLTGLELGGGVSVVSESGTRAHGGSIAAGNVSLLGDGSNQDVSVVGAEIRANNLTAINKSGNVSIVAAQGQTSKTNWSISGNAPIGLNTSTDTTGADTQISFDSERSTTYQVGHINAENVNLKAGQNIALQTDLQAGVLNGQAGGNLAVSSAQNQANSVQFDFTGGASGLPNLAGQTTPVGVISAIGNAVINAVTSGDIASLFPNGSVALTVDNTTSTRVNTIHAEQMYVTAGGGQVTVNAANLSSNGGTGFGTAAVSSTSYQDNSYHFNLDGALSGLRTASLPTVGDLLNGKPLQLPVALSVKQSSTVVDALVDVK